MADDGHKQSGAGAQAIANHGIQDLIGRSLRAHFDDIIAAPMPDRFLVLLSQLESKEQELAGKSASAPSDHKVEGMNDV